MSIHVELWTDGACSGNPGPGGWAAILHIPGRATRELSGGDDHTTNNRMELTGVLEGLRFLKEPCQVTIHTDSTYVLKAFEENWIAGWQKRGWKTASGKPVANQEIWEELIVQVARHQVRWVWIKGHNGTRFNERADYLAVCESQSRR